MSDDDLTKLIRDTDEVDLLGVLRVLREAQVRATVTGAAGLSRDVQDAQDRALDRDGARALGDIAARDCARFEGERPTRSEYRDAKERSYSMYALHPNTAEQIIKAIEFLLERFGRSVRAPTRPTRIEPKTVRNEAR